MAKILVAENNRLLFLTIAERLRHEGHEVDTVESAEEAWKKLQEAPYDLLVTDNEMYVMSGLELIGLVRNRPEINEMKIIMNSGDEDKALPGKLAELDAVLVSKFSPNIVLFREIHIALGER